MDSSQFQEVLTSSLREILSNLPITTPLSSVKTPEYSGEKNEDVIDWLEKYESSTIALNDENKKQLLSSSFVRSARAWYKDDLLPIIHGLSWKEAKKVILKRYKPNQRDYYIEKASRLKYYDEGHQDLASFVDQKVHLIKVAHPKRDEQEIIQETLLSIPSRIRSQLNLMSDTEDIKRISDFKTLVNRYDSRINVQGSPTTTPAFSKEVFESLLRAAVDKVIVGRKDDEHTAAAVVTKQTDRVSQDYQQMASQNEDTYRCQCQCLRSQTYSNINQNYGYRKPTRYQKNRGPRNPAGYIPNNRYTNRNQRTRPPGPCYTCKGDHWNADCTQRNLK